MFPFITVVLITIQVPSMLFFVSWSMINDTLCAASSFRIRLSKKSRLLDPEAGGSMPPASPKNQ